MKILCLCLVLSQAYEMLATGGKVPLTQEQLKETLLRSAIQQAVEHYNHAANSMFRYTLYNVDRATSQIVAGLLFEFDLTLIPTGCRNSPANSKKTFLDCGIGQGHPQTCSYTVFVQSWNKNNDFRTTRHSCVVADHLKLHENIHHLGYNDDEEVGTLAEFQTFKKLHSKSYGSVQEEKIRYQIFQSNMKKAKTLQLLELSSGQYGMTVYSDISEDEFRASHLSPTWDLSKRPEKEASVLRTLAPPPPAFDWRPRGAVTPVKNQGSCGSCWAFSTTGNIEGQWKLRKGALVSLSEQMLVDCDKVDQGCNGGLPSQAYKEIIRLGGLETEAEYPYTGRDGGGCHRHAGGQTVYINSSVAISKDEGQMASWLVPNGPISIGINAFAMQFYMGGVSHPWAIFCSKSKLDHGVLIVGYGVEAGKNEPYWIVKNSWGPTWGEKGYYLVYRGDGTCGLNTMCTSAVIQH